MSDILKSQDDRLASKLKNNFMSDYAQWTEWTEWKFGDTSACGSGEKEESTTTLLIVTRRNDDKEATKALYRRSRWAKKVFLLNDCFIITYFVLKLQRKGYRNHGL